METTLLFSNWLSEHSTLSQSSIYKYSWAVNTISKEMQLISLITKSLYHMNLTELDDALFLIMHHPQFIAKNKKGNHMYSNALKQFRYFSLDCCELQEDIKAKIHYIEQSDLPATTKEAIIQSRIGQGEYRKQLLQKDHSTCIVTGITNRKVLIASHIKPWSISNNHERIDVNNGLLLCANLDRLFDCGLITFQNDGRMGISSFLSKEDQNRLQIDTDIQYDIQISDPMKVYLEYHRDVIFVK